MIVGTSFLLCYKHPLRHCICRFATKSRRQYLFFSLVLKTNKLLAGFIFGLKYLWHWCATCFSRGTRKKLQVCVGIVSLVYAAIKSLCLISKGRWIYTTLVFLSRPTVRATTLTRSWFITCMYNKAWKSFLARRFLYTTNLFKMILICLDIFDDSNCIPQCGSDRYLVTNHFQKILYPSLFSLDSNISSSMLRFTTFCPVRIFILTDT